MEQRALSTAGRTNNGKAFTSLDGQVEILRHIDPAVAGVVKLGDVGEGKQRHKRKQSRGYSNVNTISSVANVHFPAYSEHAEENRGKHNLSTKDKKS